MKCDRAAEGSSLRLVDDHGDTVLHHALALCGLAEVAALLRANAPLNTANHAGDLPLHIAARLYSTALGIEGVLSKLAGPGVDVNAPDSCGVPLICRVAAAGNKAATLLVLSKGGKACAADRDGRTALHYLSQALVEQLAAARGRRPAQSVTAANESNSKTSGSLFQQLQSLTQSFAEIVDMLVVRAGMPVPRASCMHARAAACAADRCMRPLLRHMHWCVIACVPRLG
jgi:predicted Fe-Mo cluster-binding NifX family protein